LAASARSDKPADIRALGHPVIQRTIRLEGDPFTQLDVDTGNGDLVFVLLRANADRVLNLSTKSPAFITSTGAYWANAGRPRSYPKRHTFLSEEEGDHFSMLTDQPAVIRVIRLLPTSIDPAASATGAGSPRS
jgi:hypothetical protein